MLSTLNFRALAWALAATIGLVLAVLVGSRNLQNFDAALVPYLFGTLFACFGIVYRYAVWVQRPPTRRFWQRSVQLMFSRRFLASALTASRKGVEEIAGQSFIFRRSRARGLAHFLLAWGCLTAFAITLPLTFGWIHFTLQEGSITMYETHVFGFHVFTFPLDSFIAFNLFHALNWSSLMVLAGVAYFVKKRMTDPGLIATQSFEFDWMPLVLLAVVSLTGLGLTLDNEFLRGRAYPFMAITHAVSVILFLVWLPFGKFFHVFQRPAQMGVALYQQEAAAGPQQVCPHTGAAFASEMQIRDLEEVTREIGMDYDLADGGNHLRLSPQGKRAALAVAHLSARESSGKFFG
jgi:hypothetical protein